MSAVDDGREDDAPRTAVTVVERPAAAVPSPRRRSATLPPGTAVGRFLTIAAVGRGGMGVVYEAYDPVLDRRIALKLMRAQGAGANATARLAREAQALARLTHPNVVAVHDVGEFGGYVFIAMELVRGLTLDRWLDERLRTTQEILDVMIAAGRGLAAAHRAGIVHRDFKPRNVIVGDDGRVRVLDFGIARAADAAEATPEPAGPADAPPAAAATGDGSTEATSGEPSEPDATPPESSEGWLSTPLTRAGTLIGTPAFMAPEQLARRSVGPRGDQFAYGVTLYHALYRQRPFPADQPEELLEAMKRGPAPPPPGAPRVPARLRKVLARALSLDPEARYPSVDALLDELARDPWARAGRIGVALALAALTAIVVILATRPGPRAASPCADAAHALDQVWTPAARARVARNVHAAGGANADETFAHLAAALDGYAGAWRTMRVQTCRATLVEETQSARLLDLRMACLDQRLAGLGALVTLLGEPLPAGSSAQTIDAALALPSLARCADADALTRVVPLPEAPAARAAIENARGRLLRAHALELAGRYEEARAALEPELPAIRALAHAPLLADALDGYASILDNLGRAEDAERTWFEATEWAARAHDAPLELVVWASLIWEIGLKQQRFAEVPLLEHAARAALARADDRAILRAQLLASMGAVHIYDGKVDLAGPELEEALAIRERELPADSYVIANTLDALGMVDELQGRLDDELALARRALAIRQRLYGDNHPTLAFSLLNLAEGYLRVGDWKAAEPYARRALAIREAALGPSHEDTAWALYTLAGVLAVAGRHDEAAAGYARVATILGPAAARGTMVGGMLRRSQGELALLRGDARGAIALLVEARDDYVASVGAEHPDLVNVYTTLGQAQLAVGTPAAALTSLEKALALTAKGPSEPRAHAELLLELARASWAAPATRARAVEQATAARALLAPLPAEPRVVELRAAVDAWLGTHAAK